VSFFLLIFNSKIFVGKIVGLGFSEVPSTPLLNRVLADLVARGGAGTTGQLVNKYPTYVYTHNF
jgi:hypothetical protein